MPSKEWREKFREREAHTCKHFTGTSREVCKAGVNYLQHAGGEFLGYVCRLPCTGDDGCKHAPDQKIVPCALREFPTLEEVEAKERRITESINSTIKARQAITDHLKANGKPLRNVNGSIPCPICNGGALGFSIASNGHCHATCSTPGCVSWIE